MKLFISRMLIVTTLLFISCSYYSVSFESNNAPPTIHESYEPTPVKTIKVAINKNLELFGLMMQLDAGPDLVNNKDSVIIENKKCTWRDWYLLSYKNYCRYKAFDSCAMMQLYRQYNSKGFTDDFFVGLLEQVNEVPFAKLNKNTNKEMILPFSASGNMEEARNNATLFLKAFNAFYTSIHFENYLTENKENYSRIIADVTKNLPGKPFLPAMESFYNKSFNAYYLVPVLNLPTSMGFGKMNKITGSIYNAFGPFSFQSFSPGNIKLGFDYPGKIRGLSVHEFGHSFVNPAIDKLPVELVQSTEYLYQPIKEDMSKLRYNTWVNCLYEHFVKAGEVLIARRLGHFEEADKILKNNVQSKFIYLPFIVKELEAFDSNTDPQKRYDTAVLHVMKQLKQAYKQ